MTDNWTAAWDRYCDYIVRRQDEARNIPFGPGKIFYVVVGDGKAYYEVTDADDKTATVSVLWPENEADDEYVDIYTDPFIRSGGTFDRERIEALTSRQDKISSIFGAK